MSREVSQPRSPRNFLLWFDPRSRKTGTFAFILNRVSAIGLTIYLFMHLVALGQLALGPAAYNSFIGLVRNPIFMAGEYLVVAAGFLHGINGLRVGLTSFGIGVQYQKQIFYSLMTLALIAILYFGIRMFGGGG